MSSKDSVSHNTSSTTTTTLKDSETQTSKVYDFSNTSVNRPGRPLPQNIENTAPPKNDKEKVFEFCEIIQDPDDPDSVSIIKEKFSEEVITTKEKGSFFEKPTANKYKYYREVIQPYSKKFCTECPSYVPPRKKDSPACPPSPPCPSSPPCPPNPPSPPSPPSLPCKPSCPIIPTQSCESPQPSQTCEPPKQSDPDTYWCSKKPQRDTINNSDSAMDCNEKCKMHCKTTFINPLDEAAKNPCKSPCKVPSKEKCSRTKLDCDKPKTPPCQRCEKVDEAHLKCCIAACIKDSVKAVKKGSSMCANEIEKAIGVKHAENCDDKPTYYVLEKPRCPSYTGSRGSSTCPPKKSSIQEFFDTQTQTVATIQCALKDFMGTVCNKTRDVIEVLRTESCNRMRSSEEEEKNRNTKDCSYVKSLTLISEKIKNQIDKIDMSTGSESLERILEPAKQALDKVASVVSSTVSLIQEANFEKIVDDALEAKFNKSSPYDRPGAYKPPEEVAQEHEPSRNANMFTTIKTKLFSIFGQRDSSHEIEDDDDDEDEDLTAEKYFDKYCDQ